MPSLKFTIIAIAAMVTSSVAQGPPSNCYQTATGTSPAVGFCVCSTPVTTLVPSSQIVYSTVPVTETVVITTSSVASYTTVTPVSTIETSTYILRGETCFPSDAASPYEAPSY